MAHMAGSALLDEIAVTRVILSRLLTHVSANPDLTTAQLMSLAPLVFNGARTISRLLRDQSILSSEVAAGVNGSMDLALDALAGELGVKL